MKGGGFQRGMALLEVVLAVGALAVALPVVMAAVAKGGEVSAKARAETRAPWVADRMRIEVEAALQGRSPWLSEEDGWAALGFGTDAEIVRTIDEEVYSAGLDGEEEVDLVAVAEIGPPVGGGTRHLLVTVEYPPARPELRRTKLVFRTRLP